MASFEDTDNILEALAPRIQETKELAQHYSNNDNDWEKLWEKVNIIASKRNMSDENKVCVRGQTTFHQSPLEVFKILQNVTDIDEVMKQHDVLMRLSPLVAIEHIYVNTPWPVTPRDGLSISFIDVDNDGTVYLLAFGYENDVICPPIKGMIRSELTITGFILKPNEQGGTNATYILQMDPMGSIPGFLKTKMTTSKPMILQNIRTKLGDVPPESASQATLEDFIEVFNAKPITSL